MHHYLIYFILPLWLVSGILDWYYHRRTNIEKTAGTRESMIHILMMSEIGFPIMIDSSDLPTECATSFTS